MKILVTGGAGFIGSNLAKQLVADPDISEIRVIDDLSSGYRTNIAGLPLNFFEASILDREALTAAADGVNAIVHLAAVGSVPRSINFPLVSHEVNATGTLHVLEAARRNNNCHVVLASSSSVYGANPCIPKIESLRCIPMSPYAVSKLATEQYAMAYARCYDLPVLPFRFFNVFGPGQMAGHPYAAVIPVFVKAALDGQPLPVNGDGEQSRDFTYINTVTDTLCCAIKQRVTAEPINLAFGTRTTLNQLIALLEELLETPLQVDYREPRAGDVKHSQADNTKMVHHFPQIEPDELRTGLLDTIHWMRTSHLECDGAP